MASSERMSGPVLTNLSSATLFAGTDELERMKSLRLKISEVRHIWQDHNSFNSLKDKIKSYINHEQLSPKTLSRVDTLLKGYTDWADMDYHRPLSQKQSFTAIELYCSKKGYNLLFGIFNAVLREKDTDDGTLLVAAGLVELVTIELYNLRLSNIGDPRYRNYEGVTYRGMGVSTEMAEAYRKAAQHPELARRHFAVPLGFTSSSTSEETMKEFVKQYPKQEQMLWTIHIHGLDASLVKKYEERYPDSVVTSISAMPVGRIAELREKEILLRGAFFHIVGMESKEEEGRWVHRLVVVVMNTNRDHGTELALDEGGKQEQRNFFRDVVLASRFKICAELARDMGNGDVEGYEKLARKALERIDVMSELSKDFGNLSLHCPREAKVVTWHGDITDNYLPSNYLALKRRFHIAAKEGNWNVVRDIIAGEYEWEMTDWFHVTALEGPYRGRTLLHYMATNRPPKQNSEQEKGWLYLLGKLNEREVWRTLRTNDTQQTAARVAQESGNEDLVDILKPRVERPVNADTLASWQDQLDKLIEQTLKENEVPLEDFSKPQLSILTEMKNNRLWIPLPGVYMGFTIEMNEAGLEVEKTETCKGEVKSSKTKYQFKR